MKKILAGMMALLMTASLAGCSGGDASSTAPQASGENGNSEEEVTLEGEITFSTWGSLAEKEINEEIIAAFEEKYPGTKINLEYIPENYTQKIDTIARRRGISYEKEPVSQCKAWYYQFRTAENFYLYRSCAGIVLYASAFFLDAVHCL